MKFGDCTAGREFSQEEREAERRKWLLRAPVLLGATTIIREKQVVLPVNGLERLGWQEGDQLFVQAVGEDTLFLRRKPHNPAEYYAGKLGHVFGSPEETARYLEEERRSWAEE